MLLYIKIKNCYHFFFLMKKYFFLNSNPEDPYQKFNMDFRQLIFILKSILGVRDQCIRL